MSETLRLKKLCMELFSSLFAIKYDFSQQAVGGNTPKKPPFAISDKLRYAICNRLYHFYVHNNVFYSPFSFHRCVYFEEGSFRELSGLNTSFLIEKFLIVKEKTILIPWKSLSNLSPNKFRVDLFRIRFRMRFSRDVLIIHISAVWSKLSPSCTGTKSRYFPIHKEEWHLQPTHFSPDTATRRSVARRWSSMSTSISTRNSASTSLWGKFFPSILNNF